MMTTKRVLLVVEDDEFLNKALKMHCEAVLKELTYVEGTVEQAFNYNQAKDILQRQPADFISVDIALSQEDVDISETERKEREAGGMTLLKELQENEKSPLAVVVSGQTLQSYAIDAYAKYGILAFFQKARFDEEEYKNAVKAALIYLDATESITRLETELDIEAAQKSWDSAQEAAKLASIRIQDFPMDMASTIDLTRSKQTHPMTGLPNSYWTQERLRSKIVEQNEWALLRVMINGFNKFVAAYASQEESILFFVAHLLLKKTRETFEDKDLFIGHLGYSEHITEPTFVIIPGENSIHRVGEMARWIEDEFEKTGSKTFTPEGTKAHEPDLSFMVEATPLTGADYYFEDLHKLLDTLRLPQL